jgi:hypothetical protein
MITDALVAFLPIGSNLSLVGGVGIEFTSNVVDLLGAGVGVAPPNIIGTRTTFGTDMGVGSKRPELNVSIGTALVANTASTILRIALQAAADQGAAGNYQPSTWTDIVSEDGIALSNLTAGAVPFRVPYLPTFPPSLMPRYLRLKFSPQIGGTYPSGSFSAGTIASALVTMVRDDMAQKYAAKNFAVA